MDTATYAYYVDWDGDGDFGDAYEDITAYVLDAEWSLGGDIVQPGQISPGSCHLRLDNSTSIFSSFNSSSPIYGDILPGRRIRITMTVGITTVTMWQGYLDTILPVVGEVVEVSTADLTAHGILAEINADIGIDIAMQTGITTGAAVGLVLDAAGVAEADQTVDTGQSTLSRWWSESRSALDLLRELAEAETGLIRETKDGKVQFEDRAHRSSGAHALPRSVYGTGTLNIWNMSQEDPLNGIFNLIEAKVRTFSISDDMTLVTICDVETGIGGDPPVLYASSPPLPLTVYIGFQGEGSYQTDSSFLAVEEWGTVDFKVNTAADGSGTDITDDVDIATEEYGSRLVVTLTNNNASTGYVTLLRVNGTAVIEGDSLDVRDENTTSQTKYRKRSYPSSSQWLTAINEAEDYCAHLIALYKDPHPAVRFELRANYDATHLAEAQALDISDRIKIREDGELGLYLNNEFFVEYMRHQVDQGRMHTVEIYARSFAEDTWAASTGAQTERTVPLGIPDDLYVNAIDPEMHLVFGAQAWKHNENITGARFRAKYFSTQPGDDAKVDLRTVAEGGTLEHDGTTMFVVDDLVATQYGAQYEFDTEADGVWYYAFQFKSPAGDSVWSDGNTRPQRVTDFCPTSNAAAAGPPSDWSVTVVPDPTGRHAVIVRATRPQVNGEKIWAWVVQIKDCSTYGFHDINSQPGGTDGPTTFFPCDEVNSISWSASQDNRRFTRESGVGLDLGGGDAMQIGLLVLLDVRGGANDSPPAEFDEDYCQWATVDTIQGLKSGFNLATATYFDIAGRFRNIPQTGLRLQTASPPWEWTAFGYFGASSNKGLYAKDFWSKGQKGNTSTSIFESDPIDVPAEVSLTAVKARVWFDNGYSRSAGGVSGGIVSSFVQSETGAQYIVYLEDAETITLDCNLGCMFSVTLGGDRSLSIVNGQDGQPIGLRIRQDGTGGRTLGFLSPSDVLFGDMVTETAYELSTTPDAVDFLGFIYDAAKTAYEVVSFVKGYGA